MLAKLIKRFLLAMLLLASAPSWSAILLLSAAELATEHGAVGNIYILRDPPHTAYIPKGDGGPMVPISPVTLTAAEIASPTAAQLAAVQTVYQLNVAPYTRYYSNGTSLAAISGGTVLASAGSLTSNALVLGAGTVETKVASGLTTDGTSKITLGVAGTSVGRVDFKNATSGTITLSPVTGALGSVTLSLPAATDTLVGKATTDTLTNKTLTAPVIASISNGGTVTVPSGTVTLATTGQALAETFCVAASDETTALTTGTAKVTFRMPFAMTTLSSVRASLATAQTSGSVLTINVKESGTTIFSTKPTFDNTEKTTQTAATASVLSDTALADDAEMQIDIDQVGDGTAKGLKVCLIGSR